MTVTNMCSNFGGFRCRSPFGIVVVIIKDGRFVEYRPWLELSNSH